MLHAVAAGRESCIRKLQARIVGDVEPPIVVQRLRTRHLDVAVSDADEFCDLAAAGFVGFQPTEFPPVF